MGLYLIATPISRLSLRGLRNIYINNNVKMNLLSKVGRYSFLSEPFHCDFSQRLFIGRLGNILLNAADFHSNERGYGMAILHPLHKTWVLSRLAIELEEMPTAYQKFYVETWVEGVMKYFTNRNFAVVDEDGQVFGYGRSVWAMIDMDTRQPIDIQTVNDGIVTQYVEPEKTCPIDKPSRVKMTDAAQRIRTISTCYSDVDMNGHINSVKYIEHVMNLWNMDFHRSHQLKRIDVAYVAEAHGGDELAFYLEQTGAEEYCVRITKYAKAAPQEVEVCRCKLLFFQARR